VFAVLVPSIQSTTRADWKSDQAYLDRLRHQIRQLEQLTQPFEAYRKAVAEIEGSLASLTLPETTSPQANDAASLQRLVRSLQTAHPGLKLVMKQLSQKREQGGFESWRWQIEIEGSRRLLGWIGPRLRQEGLYAEPTPYEPLAVTLDHALDRCTMRLVAYQLRLPKRSPDKPQPAAGKTLTADPLVGRRDPLAVGIRKAYAQLADLRARAAELSMLETRLDSLRRFIQALKKKIGRGTDPFQALTAATHLEFVLVERAAHRGAQLAVWGRIVASSAQSLARRWLARRIRPTRLELNLTPLPRPSSPASLALARDKRHRRSGGVGVLIAAASRPMDLIKATGSRASVVALSGDKVARVKTSATPLVPALFGIARSIGAELAWDGDTAWLRPAATVVPSDSRGTAPDKAGKGPRREGRQVSLELPRTSLGHVLSTLRQEAKRPIFVPHGLIRDRKKSLALIGSATVDVWLALLARVLDLDRGSTKDGVTLRFRGSKEPLFPVPQSWHERNLGPGPRLDAPLLSYRVRLLWIARRKSFAIVSEGDGVPIRVQVGSRLGRRGAVVTKITPRGILLQWKDQNIGGPITLES
jgi:hypothetical protein